MLILMSFKCATYHVGNVSCHVPPRGGSRSYPGWLRFVRERYKVKHYISEFGLFSHYLPIKELKKNPTLCLKINVI